MKAIRVAVPGQSGQDCQRCFDIAAIHLLGRTGEGSKNLVGAGYLFVRSVAFVFYVTGQFVQCQPEVAF